MTFEPDSLTGSILAVEGISDARAVLNGPTGCKYYHGSISDLQLPRHGTQDFLRSLDEFYFGQARVPCTYLDGEDYISGSIGKLDKILPRIAECDEKLIVVINSPGASLIGDDFDSLMPVERMEGRFISIESPGYSKVPSDGFQDSVISILEWMGLKPDARSSDRVNLIGLSIIHQYWEGSRMEIERLLSAMGLEVQTAISANDDLDSIRHSNGSSYNIIVYEEYGRRIADWYESNLGIPSISSPEGLPVGFDSIESWVRLIAETTGRDPKESLDLVKRARGRAHILLNKFYSTTGLPRGATFAVMADSSMALPLTKWLYNYLGMAPIAVKTVPGGNPVFEDALREFLGSKGFGDSWDRPVVDEPVDILFADCNTIRSALRSGLCRKGIEITLPIKSNFNFTVKSYLGVEGALRLLDEIINGLWKE